MQTIKGQLISESSDEFTYYTMSPVRHLCQIGKQWLRVLDRKWTQSRVTENIV